jgi:hypothetical protein
MGRRIAYRCGVGFDGGMPKLARRRYRERSDCWHVYFGDVHVGTIAARTGNPHDTDQWEWCCGFYPGSHPGECTNGSAATFDQARADFEAAWRVFLAKRTEADFQAWRDARDWTARKYAMWERGERLPSQKPAAVAAALASAPMTTAAQVLTALS